MHQRVYCRWHSEKGKAVHSVCIDRFAGIIGPVSLLDVGLKDRVDPALGDLDALLRVLQAAAELLEAIPLVLRQVQVASLIDEVETQFPDLAVVSDVNGVG